MFDRQNCNLCQHSTCLGQASVHKCRAYLLQSNKFNQQSKKTTSLEIILFGVPCMSLQKNFKKLTQFTNKFASCLDKSYRNIQTRVSCFTALLLHITLSQQIRLYWHRNVLGISLGRVVSIKTGLEIFDDTVAQCNTKYDDSLQRAKHVIAKTNKLTHFTVKFGSCLNKSDRNEKLYSAAR